ncbi:CHASE2 domain-containing protein [Vacuolonema iberomarrocanum]|uniref:CHASE2 domain-containing protein n=1 Tax=Vacuolonema iberomarrocanum TaxID=3454632 RepID=UPI0019DE0369|nr:diguanylate cyclase [filamentous cyanobacterium LEGE 07170]
MRHVIFPSWLNLPTRDSRKKLWKRVRRIIFRNRRPLMTAIATAGCVLGVRYLGLLQPFELATFDVFIQQRPGESPDPRIVIVTIDDPDIEEMGSWPLSDADMAAMLKEIRSYNPRLIGLDIYRDISVGMGRAELRDVFETTPNLIGIEKIADDSSLGVHPPPLLEAQGQVGFNNVILDIDGHVRRSILFWQVEEETHRSFALQLVLAYLEAEGRGMAISPTDPNSILLGDTPLPSLQPNSGSYVGVDAGGYQILHLPRQNSQPFEMVSLTKLMRGDVDADLFRDRIVLIGSTAASLKDFFMTAHTDSLAGSARPISGVELQGHFISQLLSVALDGRSPVRFLADPLEIVWISSWAMLGVALSWKLRRSKYVIWLLLIVSTGLIGGCFIAFLGNWWVPILPALLTLWGGGLSVMLHTAYLQEELRKSKDFLQSVINTIPDPVFVKDRFQKWIVLNEAFAHFVGYAPISLLNQNDFNIFPIEQAEQLLEQDQYTLETGESSEAEVALTNLNGHTYQVAVKRSLHKDAAGNRFLVGIIHDITRQKQVEVELRRQTEELARTNAELKRSEDHLRHLAYHDGLTGLPNRDLFMEQLDHFISWAAEHDKLVSVLFLDLDGFKHINDTYGHAIGDLLLKAVARRLSNSLRSSDILGRFGGDEFVVLLPGIHSAEDIEIVARKLVTAVTQPFVLEQHQIHVTTSIGISFYPHHAQKPKELVDYADQAMYRAKEMGKNRYTLAKALLSDSSTASSS